MSTLSTRQAGRQTQISGKRLLEPGQMLQSRYQIGALLGVGGFSAVYLARDLRFPTVNKVCAVKEMVNLAADPRLQELTIRAFEREAALLATLDHPALPVVYDYFSEADRSYLVMEFIRGKDLEATLMEYSVPLNQEKVLAWTLQICEVLEYLHNHQPQPIVFRDVKPSNLMLDGQGRIRLIDFGIAKVFQAAEKGTMVGTEGYTPPEQYKGEASPAGDIYALGATLHHLLTRRDPRTEPPFSWNERPISAINPTVTPSFEAVILRCLAYKAEDRFPNATALKMALVTAVTPTKVGLASSQVTVIAEAPDPSAVAPLQTAADGLQPLWTFACGDEIRSAPVAADGVVYVGAYDNHLYALKAQTGELLWKFATGGGIATAPAVYGDYVIVASADRKVYCLRRRTGRQAWLFGTEGPIYSSPRAAVDHVFFGSDDGHLYAINIISGRLIWKMAAASPIRSSPCVADERIFFGTEAGYVFCLDLSGKMKWQYETRQAVTSSPAVANDIVYVGSMDTTVYALDTRSGWAIWRFRARRPVISSPTVANDTVYAGSSDGYLYALDATNGRQTWAYQTQGQVTSSPAVWQDAVYVGSTDKHVYSLSTRHGRLRWRFATGGLVVSSPAIANQAVYIGSADRHLYALPL